MPGSGAHNVKPMNGETSTELPATLPVMVLPGVTLFPNALLPLHIFETRYRLMLEEALVIAGCLPWRCPVTRRSGRSS